DYQYGKVFIRPRDGFDAAWGANSTPVNVDLGGSYRQLMVDGSLGSVVTSISLVGAAGAIMLPYSSGDCDTPPTVPNPTSPTNGATITTATPELCLTNSTQPGDCSQPIRYHFQVAADAGFTQIVAENNSVSEGSGTTCWTVTIVLSSGQSYYWRTRAGNGISWSSWTGARSFTVEIQNDPPSPPGANSPADGDSVTTQQPTLTVNNATDPEGATPTYHFQVSTLGSFTPLAAEATSVPQGSGVTSWHVGTELANETLHYWRARSFDGSNYSTWSTTRSFFVHDTDSNSAPTVPTANYPSAGETVGSLSPTLVINNPSDPDGDPLTIRFQVWSQNETTLHFQSAEIPVGASTTACVVGVTLAGETGYKWRACAYDGSDYSAWMEMTQFYTPAAANHIPSVPVLMSPVNGDTVLGSIHILALHNSSDADGDPLTYDFRVCSDAAMTKTVESAAFVGQMQPYTYHTTTATYSSNRVYYWYARANDGTVWTNWCTPQSFYHAEAVLDVEDAAATLVSPPDGGSVADNQPILTATWQSASAETAFLFEVSESEDFSRPLTYGLTYPNDELLSWQVDLPLEQNQTYYWRVRQGDGGVSAMQSFTVAATIHVTPNPFSYLDGDMVFRNLPPDSRIDIFTVAGDPVTSFDSVGGDYAWNALNDSGDKLASGVYLYYVTSNGERFSDKFVVVR
ncbi:MAG: hypothetical protein ABIJ61_06625, partial [bacterium]